MSYFQLTSNGLTYNFDSGGGVSLDGGVAGTWTTNAVNQIVVTLADESVITFEVSWAFNAKNQLTIIQSNGTEVFNFSSGGVYNSFTTRDSTLLVKPDRSGVFTFPLQGDWAMTPDHDLTFTINGVASTLDGFVSDPIGRFIFHFANLDNVLETNVLGFVGFWGSRIDAVGTPLLDFVYQTAGQTAGGEKIFGLPEALAINRSSNQLTYAYTKGNKSLSIDFQGTLMIGPDFEIAYVVQPQVSSSGEEMVSSSTLTFSSTLAQPNLHGDLELAVGPSTFEIGGQYQGVLGKAGLQVGFTFTQTFGGADNQITRTAAFSGALAFNDGQVQWTFSATGTSIDLAVGVDIKLGAVQLDARLNLPLGGGQSGVTFLLGVSF
jgi:hypothetical protein